MQEFENIGKNSVWLYFFLLIYIKAMFFLVFNLEANNVLLSVNIGTLTAQNIPLIDWSKTTLNNVLLPGDKMYLQALDNGFVVLEPGVEFVSV
jgi:hypothetical protein